MGSYGSMVAGLPPVGDGAAPITVILPIVAAVIVGGAWIAAGVTARRRLVRSRLKLAQFQIERGSWTKRSQRRAYIEDQGIVAESIEKRDALAEEIATVLESRHAGLLIDALSDLPGRALSSMALPNRTAYSALQSERTIALHAAAVAREGLVVDPLIESTVEKLWRAVEGTFRFRPRDIRQLNLRRIAAGGRRSNLHAYYEQLAFGAVINSVGASVMRSPRIYGDLLGTLGTLGALGAQTTTDGKIVPTTGEMSDLFGHPLIQAALSSAYEDLAATIAADLSGLRATRAALRVTLDDWAAQWPLESVSAKV